MSNAKDGEKLIIISDRFWVSVFRDFLSVVATFAILLPGVVLESWTLSFVGLFLLAVIMFGFVSGVKDKNRYTLEEASEEIERLLSQRTEGEE